jgi:hypothetical protein
MGRTKLSTELVMGGLVMLIVPPLALGLFTVNWSSRASIVLKETNCLAWAEKGNIGVMAAGWKLDALNKRMGEGNFFQNKAEC